VKLRRRKGEVGIPSLCHAHESEIKAWYESGLSIERIHGDLTAIRQLSDAQSLKPGTWRSIRIRISTLHLLGACNFSFKENIFEWVVLDPKTIINAFLTEIGSGGVSNRDAMLIVGVKDSDHSIVR